MIAVRRLPRCEWEATLRARGCCPAADGKCRDIQTAEWWVAPTIKVFTVPIDEEGYVTQFDLEDLVKMLRDWGWLTC